MSSYVLTCLSSAVSQADVGDFVVMFYESWPAQIFLVSHDERRQFLTWKPTCFASVVFILMLLDCSQRLNGWFYLSSWTCHLFHRPIWWQKPLQIRGSGNFKLLNLFLKPLKRAESCIWSQRNEGRKVTDLRLFEHKNMSEVIYSPVLSRRWVMDFHSWAGKSSSMQWSHWLIREGLGWMEGSRRGGGVWTLCEPLNFKKRKKKDDILPYLSICCKLWHLFTIYFIYFGIAWPGLINIFCCVCCLLERDLIGTRWRLFEVSVALALKLGGWKQSIQIWLEDNLEMNFGFLWRRPTGDKHVTSCWLNVTWDSVMQEHKTGMEKLLNTHQEIS